MPNLTYETQLKTLGLTRVIVHKITPYCPTMELIGIVYPEKGGLPEHLKSCYQHVRPELNEENEGFKPIYTLKNYDDPDSPCHPVRYFSIKIYVFGCCAKACF